MEDPELFAFGPNWRESVTVESEFKTDIATSRSGREQRAAVRNEPRMEVTFTVGVRRDRLRAFQRLLARFQSHVVMMGDPTRKVDLEIAVTAPTQTITVVDEPRWLVVGAKLLLEYEDRREILTVQSINFQQITFTTPATQTWPAGTAIRPTLLGMLSASISAKNITDELAEQKITLSVLPGYEPVFLTDTGFMVHDGREVFPFIENWGEEVSTKFDWARDTVDFGYGRTDYFAPTSFGTMTRQSSYIGVTADQAQRMSDFFNRMKGQRGEFYWPTGISDLVPMASLVEGTNTMRIAGRETYDSFHGDTVYRCIAIRLFDGRMIYRTVTGMTLSGGNITIIQFDKPWLFGMTTREISCVSWMVAARFASDQFTGEWVTSEVMQTQMSIRSLEDLTVENPTVIYDGAADWVFENWGEAGINIMDRLDWIVNTLYPAIFFIPEAWVHRGEADVDRFDVIVNVRWPQVFD